MKRTLVIAAWGFLTGCGALAQGPVERALLPDFRASVRFHFRERVPKARPGEKAVTAPGYHEEGLPPAQLLPEKQRRVIEGKVPDLPFVFNLRLTRPDPQKPPLLEVNVVDPHTGRSITGFPAKHDLTRDGAAFDVPISKGEARKARRALGNDALAFLTHLNVVVTLLQTPEMPGFGVVSLEQFAKAEPERSKVVLRVDLQGAAVDLENVSSKQDFFCARRFV
jgi:hypothetical protein